MPEQTPTNPPLIEWDTESFGLDVEAMDSTHEAFIALLNQLHAAADNPRFVALFGELIRHTEGHFNDEQAMMLVCGFPAISEHVGEHQRILGEMVQIGRRVDKGLVTFGRAYVRDRLPDWFRLHAATMDSALAAHWKAHENQSPGPGDSLHRN
jgi:hemerythrin-like metal-binding protein